MKKIIATPMSLFGEELAELSKQQAEVLTKARFTDMTTEEIAGYDLRRQRIALLCKLLEQNETHVLTKQPAAEQNTKEANYSRVA
jgi:hypothetical protein